MAGAEGESRAACRGDRDTHQRRGCLSSVVKGGSGLPQELRLRWAFLLSPRAQAGSGDSQVSLGPL